MEPETYIRALNTHLTYLFAFACKINEVDTFAALFLESRGAQDAGWNTVATASEVFSELKALGSKSSPLTRTEVRQMLCLYAQLAEAGGVYEGLLNTMQVAQLKPYNLWPFQDLVRVRQSPRAVVGPNANAMFRRLAEVAFAIGMTGLARLLEIAFRDDIRNAIAHADYILVPEGLRLRRRNGGQSTLVSNAEMVNAVQVSLFFFELLHAFRQATAESFRPARIIVGRFSANPPMPYKLELKDDGSLSLSTDAPGLQVDAAYERQRRINDRLGGQMVAAYISPGIDLPPALLPEISTMGFEVLIIGFENETEFAALIAEVTEHGLWDAAPIAESANHTLLMVTPLGFRKVSTGAEFKAWLPVVDEVHII
ncbi:hypothetical protein [Eoetvoesiella caeni]|uniref:Uncharacterized protein n=1 Tax=Eoetvoesiella caeni TaxID=645616 RepID=A0A366HHQ8_9BURK|nr:hypothetical protein [Eoetvoesiella caeni]MCI2808176.1 hypothetical protein [Eoetvoesiella caeni]NYT53821.1 hypothetical protein [Eoetvoesiella caeni]RBP42099.1 hypothetical protein DFR37_102485 [Eoetvoesiella caeni]